MGGEEAACIARQLRPGKVGAAGAAGPGTASGGGLQRYFALWTFGSGETLLKLVGWELLQAEVLQIDVNLKY